jgi:hypothetical protein
MISKEIFERRVVYRASSRCGARMRIERGQECTY